MKDLFIKNCKYKHNEINSELKRKIGVVIEEKNRTDNKKIYHGEQIEKESLFC